mmetsp:Transcript_48361/g.155496  ORF Transcript_48361/g.155496 Transcript_48361/m.155496 type:complete len:389 (+) Transcript_48361:1233-2399(+)
MRDRRGERGEKGDGEGELAALRRLLLHPPLPEHVRHRLETHRAVHLEHDRDEADLDGRRGADREEHSPLPERECGGGGAVAVQRVHRRGAERRARRLDDPRGIEQQRAGEQAERRGVRRLLEVRGRAQVFRLVQPADVGQPCAHEGRRVEPRVRRDERCEEEEEGEACTDRRPKGLVPRRVPQDVLVVEHHRVRAERGSGYAAAAAPSSSATAGRSSAILGKRVLGPLLLLVLLLDVAQPQPGRHAALAGAAPSWLHPQQPPHQAGKKQLEDRGQEHHTRRCERGVWRQLHRLLVCQLAPHRTKGGLGLHPAQVEEGEEAEVDERGDEHVDPLLERSTEDEHGGERRRVGAAPQDDCQRGGGEHRHRHTPCPSGEGRGATRHRREALR